MNMQLHHIGYVTGNILNTAHEFGYLGYIQDEIVDDPIQKCKICMLHNPFATTIELVEPYESNKSLQKLLAMKGTSPYHMCYEVEDVQRVFDELSETEGWTPLFRPVEAAAFNNRLITYFWNEAVGFVEFVNK